MPGVVGMMKVNNVSGSGILHVGDVFNIAPVSTLKTFAGAGSFNTGDYMRLHNYQNETRTDDTDDVDMSIYGNL